MSPKTGTVDNPTAVTVPAEYYIDKSDDLPALVVTVKLADLGIGGRWQYDSVLHIEDDKITMLCYPDEDDEGWARLDEVGEW
jgi:hypothetical protein